MFSDSGFMQNKKKIIFGEREVEYVFRKRKLTRRIRLSVNLAGEVVLSAPWWVSAAQAQKLMLEKADWVLARLDSFQKKSTDPLFRPIDWVEYQKIKKSAEKLTREKLEKFNLFYGFSYGRVSIRNQKSRWGSCSRQGNLNFNCRIVYLPDAWADYLVVHELCHLKEFNHGKKFWELVEKTIPSWRQIKKAMRKID